MTCVARQLDREIFDNVLLKNGLSSDIKLALILCMLVEVSSGEVSIVARDVFRNFCCSDRQLVIDVLVLHSIMG